MHTGAWTAGATLGATGHTSFKILTAAGKSKYRTPGVLGSGQVSFSRDPSRGQALISTHFYSLQVLHKVMAVTGLQRVPEEHDVRGEMQTLQVMSRGAGGGGEQVLVPYDRPSTSFLASCQT